MGKEPNFIVVIRGLKTGVFDDWLEAEEYCEPVRFHRGLWQGFPTREQAENRYQILLEKGRVEILRLPNSSSQNMTPPAAHAETPASSRHQSPHTPAQTGGFRLYPQLPDEETASEIVARTQRVSVTYPNDKKHAYLMPKEIKRTQSAGVQASPRAGTISSSKSSSSSSSSSQSPTGSLVTALTSLSVDEVQSMPKSPTRSQIVPGNALGLSPILSPRLSTTEEVHASSNHSRSPRSSRASPIKKSSSQLSTSPASRVHSPTGNHAEQSNDRRVEASPLRKRLVSINNEHRSSPTQSYSSPPKSDIADAVSIRTQGSPTKVRVPDARSPLVKKNLDRAIYGSLPSSGRPSPQVLRMQSFSAIKL